MKQTMSDLSILQRVYLGFAILVAVMVASAVLTFRGQSELNDALDQVTQESMPLVIASSQTQISLLSANKWLTDVLTEQDPKQLPRTSSEKGPVLSTYTWRAPASMKDPSQVTIPPRRSTSSP